MPRPAEYDNLIERGALKNAASTPESVAQFMRTASQMQAAALPQLPAAVRFTLAYEGMFNVVMAVLEHRGARPGDGAGHRATALQRVAADLQLEPAHLSALTRLHDTRNRVTYRMAIPPITKADAEAMQTILDRMLDAATRLTGAGAA